MCWTVGVLGALCIGLALWPHPTPEASTAQVGIRGTLVPHKGAVRAVAFSPDGRFLATGGDDNAVWLWDAATRREIATMRGHTDGVTCLVFSPDGKLLAAVHSHDSEVKIWEVATGRQKLRLEGNRVAFSPDGKVLACAGFAEVKLWDLARAEWAATLKRRRRGTISLAFSPDGKLLASGCLRSAPAEIELWDVVTGQAKPSLQSPPPHYTSSATVALAFTPGGKLLVSGHMNGLIHLWDMDKRKLKGSIRADKQYVLSLAMSPDGKTIASAGYDHAIHLWEVATEQQRATLKGNTHEAASVAFNHDGTVLASGGYDGTVRIWSLARVMTAER